MLPNIANGPMAKSSDAATKPSTKGESLEALNFIRKLSPSESSLSSSLRADPISPPIKSEPKGAERAAAHGDINLITLLVGAEESGLEVQNPNDEWIPIAAKSKSIVCNIGDMMQLVTRSKLKSTSHRVVDHNSSSSASRYSMPFFLHPSPEIELCSIVDDSTESISAHDFLEERLKAIKLY